VFASQTLTYTTEFVSNVLTLLCGMVSSVKEILMHAYQFQILKWILKIKDVNVNWVTEVFLELVSPFLDILLLVANYIQNSKDLDGFSLKIMMIK
jgi:hypothetical protein